MVNLLSCAHLLLHVGFFKRVSPDGSVTLTSHIAMLFLRARSYNISYFFNLPPREVWMNGQLSTQLSYGSL